MTGQVCLFLPKIHSNLIYVDYQLLVLNGFPFFSCLLLENHTLSYSFSYIKTLILEPHLTFMLDNTTSKPRTILGSSLYLGHTAYREMP